MSSRSLPLFGLLLLVLFISFPFSGHALRVNQIEFNLNTPAGGNSTHTFAVLNDENDAVNVEISVMDWVRSVNGQNAFFPANSAQIRYPYSVPQGEPVKFIYRIEVPQNYEEEGFSFDGSMNASTPSIEGTIGGTTYISLRSGESRTSGVDEDLPLEVTRSVSLEEEGTYLRVTLTARAPERTVRGVRIVERFPVGVSADPVRMEGAKFRNVDRSCADWIDISPAAFTLESEAKREVEITMDVPKEASGGYWSAVMVRGLPQPAEGEGATVTIVKRFGIKIYETVPDTEKREGYVTDIRTVRKSPPQFEVGFENEGNVQLDLSGEIRLIDESGAEVLKLKADHVPVLPGYKRLIKIPPASRSKEELSWLEPGKYQALAVMDFGGANRLGARTSFRVEELSLRPIGSSDNVPRDPDGDRLYEDVNGDGKLTSTDYITFGLNEDSPPVQENVRAFDFNLDGRVNIKDLPPLQEVVKGAQ